MILQSPFKKKNSQEEDMYKEASNVSISSDITYTIVPGETKKNYCKIMTNIRIFTGEKPFTLAFAKKKIMVYGKKRIEKQYKSGDVRSERKEIPEEEANSLISNLIQQRYLVYYTTVKRDKAHPTIPEDGIKYYMFDNFKVIECQQSKYFKQKMQRTTKKLEVTGTLSDKRCRALRQIYAQFGDKVPFTIEMVKNIPKFYKKMAEDKTQEISEESRIYYRTAAQYSESKAEDFDYTWNSLIRNNFLIPYKIRAKDGTIKVRQGAYKVNMTYARRCLSEINS